MRKRCPLPHALVSGLALLLAQAAAATELRLSIEIPRLQVAEYHRPYVAVWVEGESGVAANLAVWYDLELRNNEGEKWLKDMRQWWRRSGRGLSMPVDGVTGATRPPGVHALRFKAGEVPLGDLPAGEYRLLVEAAREVGGREVVTLPFQWPPQAGARQQAQGEHELGTVTLEWHLP